MTQRLAAPGVRPNQGEFSVLNAKRPMELHRPFCIRIARSLL
ncbi:hypothetical protein XHV734_4385 [Xanthomonas hortorum pv. vitians]|nr:hypothetical protein XHV734_4385 [Xanthomonas hortorum pv. vitians]